MSFSRKSGLLLHPTSLPGPYGIGDLGPQAHGWIDFLAETGTGLWQVLPLGPTGYGDSPYQCFSAFAGNPYLISPDALLQEGLLSGDDLQNLPNFPAGEVDYGRVIPWKLDLLNRAFQTFQNRAFPEIQADLKSFRKTQTHWVDDYALFMAVKESQSGKPWVDWPPPLRDRLPRALEEFQKQHRYQMERQIFFQFLFFRQWDQLRSHAHQQGVKIIGDIPIFVAHDSADVWAHRELFYLDEKGQPTVVAGVPPDYFSETGQLWGNPLYRWEVHRHSGYRWWLDRLQAVLSLVDIVRLDHFRGFAGYWEIPAGEETAVEGEWKQGPGANFFHTVKDKLGELPIIAEDLGEITPDVIELREQFGLPGMKVLVFAFGSGPENEFLPHHYPENCAVYTGTHDNDTAVGWYRRVGEEEKSFARRYLNISGEDIAWDLIRAAWGSVAVLAVAPLQDLLSLDNSARMNYPGSERGNWNWRMEADDLESDLRNRLKEVNHLYSRTAEFGVG
jgi:4-alpha-glucanotransferase